MYITKEVARGEIKTDAGKDRQNKGKCINEGIKQITRKYISKKIKLTTMMNKKDILDKNNVRTVFRRMLLPRVFPGKRFASTLN